MSVLVPLGATLIMLIAYAIHDPFGGIIGAIVVFAMFYQVWRGLLGELLVLLGLCEYNPWD